MLILFGALGAISTGANTRRGWLAIPDIVGHAKLLEILGAARVLWKCCVSVVRHCKEDFKEEYQGNCLMTLKGPISIQDLHVLSTDMFNPSVLS